MKKCTLFLLALSFTFIAQSQQSWSLGGNGGTNPANNFLGTKDNRPLRFRINNLWAGELDSASTRTFFGYGAGKNTTSGSSNVAIGYKPLYFNTTGGYNTAIGVSALYSNTTGSYNTANGFNALASNTTGNNNTAVGIDALYTNSTGTRNTAIGMSSQYWNTGNDNTALGFESLNQNTTGTRNTAIGASALWHNTTGIVNVGIGPSALYSNTTGYGDIAIGYYALYSNTVGYANTAIGNVALTGNTEGTYNTATGSSALSKNANGRDNTADGAETLSANLTGSYNTAVGSGALFNITDSYNTAIGSQALVYTQNSQYNTAVGYASGAIYQLGYNNTILGANCDGSFHGQYNIIAIGQGVTCPDNSTARIGNSATWSIGGYADWTNFSDGRFKKDVKENVKGIDFIMKLRPITYRLDITGLSKRLKENQGQEWNEQMKTAMAKKEKVTYTGFVAQEVERAAKEMDYDFSGVDKPENENSLYGLRYAEFVVPLVKAVQEQEELIKTLQGKVDMLQTDVAIIIREQIVNEKISAYPNPTANNMTVAVTTQSPGDGTLQVFDATGKLIKKVNISIQKGTNQINLSLPNVATGSYDLKLDWGNDMHKHISIIKQ